MARAIDLGPIRMQTQVAVPEVGDWRPPVRGPEGYCPIVVLCDAPTQDAHNAGLPLHWPHHMFLVRLAKKHGFGLGDIKLVGLCPPVLRQDLKSASRKWKHVEQFLPQVRDMVTSLNPRIVVTFGELATRAMHGRPVKITKVRGIPQVYEGDAPPVFPMLSPGFVNRIPDHIPTFDADMGTLARIKDAGFDAAAFTPRTGDYRWCTDVGSLYATMRSMNTRVISVDTEGTGLRWWDPDVQPFTVQITVQPGHAFVIPVNEEWWDDHQGDGTTDLSQVRTDLKRLLEDPNIRKMGHNIKFEHMHLRKLGIEVKGWLHDTQLMLFNVDENLLDKRLETGVKVFVPEMAGYSDSFDQTYDKSDMWNVPKEDWTKDDGTVVPGLKTYAGGDSDATFRLAQRLRPMLDQDERQRNCYRRIQLPAIQCFANTIELHGMLVNQQRLTEFGETLDAHLDEAFRSLIARTPASVKADHLERGKELKFSRQDFVRDILFTEAGFNLRARTFTDSTQDLPEDQRKASTSTKKHLPYFTGDRRVIGDQGTVGDYVNDLISFQKTRTLNNNFVGKCGTEDRNPSGLWQYLSPRSRIHPSYMLHRANTGRTASADPNGQNFPVHSDWAKTYKETFEASPGFKLVSCDLSQIELRLVAWMSGDPTMLQIYRDGGDIHASTAASVMGVTLEQFMSWKGDERVLLEHANDIPGSGAYLQPLNPGARRTKTIGDFYKHKRFQAKAVNFGFIYGMSAGGFQVYAKTDYGQDFTEQECQDIRRRFFETYWALPMWHETMHAFADRHGYVRALHGAVRHLPSIYSEDEGIRAAARRYAVNSPIQRFGSDMGLIGLIRFCHQANPENIRMTGFVHDALYMEVREGMEEEAAAALKWCMETVPLQEWFGITPPLPILADAEVDGEERPDIQAVKPDWWDDDEEGAAHRYVQQDRCHMLQMAA